MTANLLFIVAMIAVTALAGGGFWMMTKGVQRRKGVLMIITALVILGNILIWSVPL